MSCLFIKLKKIYNIYTSFSVKLPNKSWIMALTQIIDSMLLFSEEKKMAKQCFHCHHPLVTFEQSHLEQLWTPSQPVSQESHPALTVSCHLPIRAGAITQMDLAKAASFRWSWRWSKFLFFLGSTNYISSITTPVPNFCAYSYRAVLTFNLLKLGPSEHLLKQCYLSPIFLLW